MTYVKAGGKVAYSISDDFKAEFRAQTFLSKRGKMTKLLPGRGGGTDRESLEGGWLQKFPPTFCRPELGSFVAAAAAAASSACKKLLLMNKSAEKARIKAR